MERREGGERKSRKVFGNASIFLDAVLRRQRNDRQRRLRRERRKSAGSVMDRPVFEEFY